MQIDWTTIDSVLLDMDGTLLDRHFDDHFWLEHVPARWAAHNKTSLAYARTHLHAMFRSQERTLNWTDLDYWSGRLGLDVPQLKEEVKHLIAVHPHVVEFLLFLKQHGKRVWLVTNAHSKTLDLKMRTTSIGPYFDGIISAHQVGLPKEDHRFWDALQHFISYDPQRTMLGEDSETNLATAEAYGIACLIYVGRFSSSLAPEPSKRYASIRYFSSLIPHPGSMTVSLPEWECGASKSDE